VLSILLLSNGSFRASLEQIEVPYLLVAETIDWVLTTDAGGPKEIFTYSDLFLSYKPVVDEPIFGLCNLTISYAHLIFN